MAWCGSQSFEHVQNHTSFHEFYRGLTRCHDLFYDLNIIFQSCGIKVTDFYLLGKTKQYFLLLGKTKRDIFSVAETKLQIFICLGKQNNIFFCLGKPK